MTIYVSEMPKNCRDCPCSIYDELDCCWCKAINGELTYITDNDFESKRLNSCPLQSLSDYTKQVRNELIDKLALFLIGTFSKDAEFSVEEILKWFQEVKDQIQGNNEN